MQGQLPEDKNEKMTEKRNGGDQRPRGARSQKLIYLQPDFDTIVYCQLSASNRAEASVEALPKFAALPSARLSVS